VSDLERTFDYHWRILGDGSEAEKQYRFHPTRRWKFDNAWPDEMVAVELEGGIFTRGRHTRGQGFHNDCDKYNAAQRLGGVVLRYTTLHMDDPQSMIDEITDVLNARRNENDRS